VPSDVHTLVPVGTEQTYNSAGMTGPKYHHPFSQEMDRERRVRSKKQKRKQKNIEYSPDWMEKGMHIQKKFHSAKNRRKLAASKNALPNGSYPIGDATDLKNAATLARSGHGDVPAAKRLISRRAQELGVSNPLAEETVGKSLDSCQPLSNCFSGLTE
jgi:hypothetical protein